MVDTYWAKILIFVTSVTGAFVVAKILRLRVRLVVGDNAAAGAALDIHEVLLSRRGWLLSF